MPTALQANRRYLREVSVSGSPQDVLDYLDSLLVRIDALETVVELSRLYIKKQHKELVEERPADGDENLVKWATKFAASDAVLAEIKRVQDDDW